MTDDLKWSYAVASAPKAFDAAERDAGWPESMNPYQLAGLQHQWVSGDQASNLIHRAFLSAIRSACTPAGGLAHEQRELTFYRTESQPVTRIRRTSIGGHMLEQGTEQVKVPDQASVPFVTAAAFAEWLRKQGEEPSEYIAHWFKVREVAAPAVLQLTPPAPAVDDAAKPDDTAPAIPTTWAELKAWPGRKEPGFVWTDNLRQIVATEKSRRSALAHTGITAAMGAELGCSARHINDLIDGIGKSGSRKQVLDNAMARMGTGTSGKNSR